VSIIAKKKQNKYSNLSINDSLSLIYSINNSFDSVQPAPESGNPIRRHPWRRCGDWSNNGHALPLDPSPGLYLALLHTRSWHEKFFKIHI
jgi:hypothetical protein